MLDTDSNYLPDGRDTLSTDTENTSASVRITLGLKMKFVSAVLADQKLKKATKLVAVSLIDRCSPEKGCAWPSYERMMRDTDSGLSTVKDAVNALEETGWFIRERRNKPGKNESDTNLYWPVWSKAEGSPELGQGGPETGRRGSPETGPKPIHLPEPTQRNTTPKPPSKGADGKDTSEKRKPSQRGEPLPDNWEPDEETKAFLVSKFGNTSGARDYLEWWLLQHRQTSGRDRLSRDWVGKLKADTIKAIANRKARGLKPDGTKRGGSI